MLFTKTWQHDKRNGCKPITKRAGFHQRTDYHWSSLSPKKTCENRSDHESEASTNNRQDNQEAVGVAEPDDQRLSTIGVVTARFTSRRGFATKTGIHGCGFRTGIGGISRGRSRRCRTSYCTRGRYVHSLGILSSTWMICTASSLAGRIVAGASSHTLISGFLAFVVWDRKGVL